MAEPSPRPGRRKQRPTRHAAGGMPPAEGGEETGAAGAMKAGYAKAEIKNQKVRESLEPLEPGQRPTAVTVGAAFAIVVSVLLWGSTVVALITGAEVDGEQVNVAQWAGLAAIFTLMAWGMWKARYWAVLGFQMLLVLLIIACVLGLVVAATLLQIVSTLFLLVGLSLLFYFMVKAMARLQMPERPGQR